MESTTNGHRVLQDLPIQLQSARKIEECEEPLLDEPKVKTSMPSLKLLSQVVDKMKAVSEYIEIEATSSGIMTFSVRQTMVRTTCRRSGCEDDQRTTAHQLTWFSSSLRALAASRSRSNLRLRT